jgi:hypothetical protein
VEAYLRLVPREWSSSEVQRRGHITKAGNSPMRWLLVEAAWRVATHKKRPETMVLREWADRIARRRGMRVAVAALARKLRGSSTPCGETARCTSRASWWCASDERHEGCLSAPQRQLLLSRGPNQGFGERGKRPWPPRTTVRQMAPPTHRTLILRGEHSSPNGARREG